jgi:electron transfer flavoprotein alpha subunit
VGRASVELDTADIVVGVGTGLGGPEHLPAIERLAAALGGAVGGTRKVVDLGWLPPHRQIGLSGRQIAPRAYLAIGVRGSFNHAVGIRRAGTVIAVNADRRAEIFGECDLGVVADWREIVPALTERVSRFGFRVDRSLTWNAEPGTRNDDDEDR